MEDHILTIRASALKKHEAQQQRIVRDLSRMAAERGALLREILEECNIAGTNGGYSLLKEETLKKIEKVLEE